MHPICTALSNDPEVKHRISEIHSQCSIEHVLAFFCVKKFCRDCTKLMLCQATTHDVAVPSAALQIGKRKKNKHSSINANHINQILAAGNDSGLYCAGPCVLGIVSRVGLGA